MTTLPQKAEKKFSDVRPGATVRIHEKIKDITPKGEERERTQIFEGIVLARKGGSSPSATITVRKESQGISVEKIFPIHSPLVTNIDVVKQAKVRRAKLYFLRTQKKRFKERK